MNTITSLNWSAPRHGIRTARGIRSLRTASPTPAFWAEWRANKAALQVEGVTCDRDDSGNWRVLQWLTPEAALIISNAAQENSNEGTPRMSRDAIGAEVEADSRPPEAGGETADKVAAPSGEVALVKFQPKPLEVDPSVKWSDEQMAIFRWFNSGKGNLVVQARAGTGKTTTIKQAFAVAPENDMLYAVFNKKNQKEAVSKITDTRVDVKTLHGLGLSYIKSVWRDAQPDDKVEYDRVYSVVGDVSDDIKMAIEKLVGLAKNLFIAPTQGDLERLALDRDIFTDSEDEEQGGWKPYKVAEAAIKVLEKAKVKDPAGRISFNDMVWLPVAMNWARARYDLVVIDEAQDMNAPQLQMAVRACRKGGRVCVVGDDRQAIYGFRGAAQDGMGMMKSQLNAAMLGLTVTYRCPKLVVAEAAKLVPDYKAADAAPEGEILESDEIKLMEEAKPGDAILSRANAPLMSTCLQLLKRGVPARIEGRDIGQQLIGMVRKLKARSVPDFLTRLQRWEDKQLNRLKGLKDTESKRGTIRDQRETLVAVAEGCASVAEIELRIKGLFQNSDDEGVKPAVVLSSVHKAKGLEWEKVFILNWTFNKRKPKSGAEAQEEKNIFYVAITRAKRTLVRVQQGGSPAVKEDKDGAKTTAA